LRAFLDSGVARQYGSLFLVNPSAADEAVNVELLRAHGFAMGTNDCYTAPHYAAPIQDWALVELLNGRRPQYVVLCIGGGAQEPLGLFLKKHLDYRPAIICTGAAIAFMTGRQAWIPTWLDASGLGWLARCIDDPSRFVRRYADAVPLWRLVYGYGNEMPPLLGQDA
jgi:N-acetylglucosaminyldiphosphoundecaprenol N-acetyl-beta-D-mannosaminyltransferase